MQWKGLSTVLAFEPGGYYAYLEFSQTFLKDKSSFSIFISYAQISITCFGFRPDYMVSDNRPGGYYAHWTRRVSRGRWYEVIFLQIII